MEGTSLAYYKIQLDTALSYDGVAELKPKIENNRTSADAKVSTIAYK